jgi:hypothetical protein
MIPTMNVFGNENNKPDLKSWFLIIFIAPIFETFFVQLLVFKICNYFIYFKQKQVLIIFVSAVVFGLMHSYNLGYMIFWIFNWISFCI